MSQSSKKKKSKQRPALRVVSNQVRTLDCDREVEGWIAILASRFNGAIVDRLVEGAIKALNQRGIDSSRILVVPVPGAWELPMIAARLGESEACSAIIALGCILRGETAHYDVLVAESARGLMQVSINQCLPISNGVLACDTLAQAEARAGGEFGNKGEEAALAALATLACAQEIVDRYGDIDSRFDEEIEDLLRDDDMPFR